ncbi:endonuclease, partial [Georgenia sp. 10Sc9-8]|nr:endonuclease [Georgenia halotolerans]
RTVPCATALEASVRELRLIAEHDPPYNRRSRRPQRRPWVRLTDEPFPRLSVVHQVPVDRIDEVIGPFASRRAATQAMEALQQAVALRRCSPRLPRTPPPGAVACVLAELGRCGAPCTGAQGHAAYAAVVHEARAALGPDVTAVVAAGRARIAELAGRQRYEEAATERDRLRAFLAGARRTERLRPLVTAPEVVAARRRPEGGWELVLVRHGRLAGTTVTAPGADPVPELASLRATGEVVPAPTTVCGAATAEETELVADWLEQEGVRLVSAEGAGHPMARSLRGAARHHPFGAG